MSPIGSVGSALTPPILTQLAQARPPATEAGGALAPANGFGQMLDGLVSSVSAKQAEANKITQSVLLGDSGQLHQSVLAMQEASVSLSLMVEVRNKLVESYQELMRMQA
jgi:flagellar hook-basal body complex protein FliE